MTIFIEKYIEKGYCKWDNGKIVVSSTCPQDVLAELENINLAWKQQYPTATDIVIFPQKTA